jgi:hypothetical protein
MSTITIETNNLTHIYDNHKTVNTLFLELTKNNRDPRLTERTTKTTIFNNQPAITIQTINLWSELNPNSIDTQQTTIQILISTKQLTETKPYLEKLLTKKNTHTNNFLYLHNLFARQTNKTTVLTIIQELTTQYPELPETHFTITQTATNTAQHHYQNFGVVFGDFGQVDELDLGFIETFLVDE